jgi:hypothetical protein
MLTYAIYTKGDASTPEGLKAISPPSPSLPTLSPMRALMQEGAERSFSKIAYESPASTATPPATSAASITFELVLKNEYQDVGMDNSSMLTYAGVFWRILTNADICGRMLTYAYIC